MDREMKGEKLDGNLVKGFGMLRKASIMDGTIFVEIRRTPIGDGNMRAGNFDENEIAVEIRRTPIGDGNFHPNRRAYNNAVCRNKKNPDRGRKLAPSVGYFLSLLW